MADYAKQCGTLYYSRAGMREILQKHLTIPTDEGIEKEEPTLHDLLGKAFVLLVNNPQNEDDHELLPHLERWLESNSIETHGTWVREVKPSIKDTIEKIWDFKDLYSFPSNPKVGETPTEEQVRNIHKYARYMPKN